MERGETQLLFAQTPTVLDRWADDGPPRASAISLDGSPVVVELDEAQNQPFLRIRILWMDADDLATFRSLVQDTGPLDVKTDPDGSAVTCAVVSYRIVNAVGRDYPDDLDSELLEYTAEVTLALL